MTEHGADRPVAAPTRSFAVTGGGRREPDERAGSATALAVPEPEPLHLTVVWGSLTETPADIHITGHYHGVMPTAAEQALDEAISRRGAVGVIAEHTRRRWLTGTLGELAHFPAPGADGGPGQVHRAAVAGMGRVGTFSPTNATRLYESVVHELDELGYIRRAALVAIGGGAGNLTEQEVALALSEGAGAALHRAGSRERVLEELLIVECDRLRAERLHEAFTDAARRPGSSVQVGPTLVVAGGGLLGPDAAAVYALRALLSQLTTAPEDPARQLLNGVSEDLREQVAERLQELSPRPLAVTAVTIAALRAAGASGRESTDAPTRVSVLPSPSGLVWSAISARATVPERDVAVGGDLLNSLVRRLTAPSAADARELPAFLTRFLVPLDLQRELDGDAPVIIEVDRETAVVPWEFLTAPGVGSDEAEPLAVRQPVARQLRTSYARTDSDQPVGTGPAALVIGNPTGDAGIAGTEEEALTVAGVLRDAGYEVDLYIGPPGGTPPPSARRTSRLDVVAGLLTRHYDIVHFAGHGVFDPERPKFSGWLFADGVLSARELAQMSTAPRMVVANACWSAARPAPATPPDEVPPGRPRPPDAPVDQPRSAARPHDGDRGKLAPILADEFFRVGVGHFIGATWRVPDRGATEFAGSLYRGLLGVDRASRLSVGSAVRAARHALWLGARGLGEDASAEERSAWAAYQHYGDPSDHLHPWSVVPAPPDPTG